MPKHNFPDISRGEHDKEGTAYLKYTKQKQNCSLYLHALSERRIFNFKQNFFFIAAKTESSDVEKSNFSENDHHFCKKVNCAKSFVHAINESTLRIHQGLTRRRQQTNCEFEITEVDGL